MQIRTSRLASTESKESLGLTGCENTQYVQGYGLQPVHKTNESMWLKPPRDRFPQLVNPFSPYSASAAASLETLLINGVNSKVINSSAGPAVISHASSAWANS